MNVKPSLISKGVAAVPEVQVAGSGSSVCAGGSRDLGSRSHAGSCSARRGFSMLSRAHFPFKATALAERSAVAVASSGFPF